jgi:pyruvate dehydrogenase E2 component (dihydrolipoamide acetyltransferase)
MSVPKIGMTGMADMATTPATRGTRTFMLPDLGEGLTEAEVIEWHVAPGDEVLVDQIVVTVETAKASVDLPCPFAGAVVTLHSEPGVVLEVGKPLLTIGVGCRSGVEPTASQRSGVEPTASQRSGVELATSAEQNSGSGNVLVGYGTSEARRSGRRRVAPGGPPGINSAGSCATPPTTDTRPVAGPSTQVQAPAERTVAPKVISPVVRKLARDNKIILAQLAPTGPGHVIRRADVEAALRTGEAALRNGGAASSNGGAASNGQEAQLPAHGMTPAAGPVRAHGLGDIRIPLRGVRRAIADKMTRSRREIPEATVWVDVDATALLTAKDEIRAVNAAAGIGVLALFARISVAALTKFPELNARVDVEAQEIVVLREINLSFAAQSPRGLVVPVVRGAGEMTTTELAAALRELTELARDGKLRPDQMMGGTFTLNNYGVFGTDGATPIINYPEAAMLGVGRIIDRPWAHEGQVALRKVAQLGLTFDHRVCDGGSAGGFLRFVADCVEKPALLLAEL